MIVGAGPAGLAAAAQAHARGIPSVVLEAGTSAGSAVLEWGHVRLFSPWSELIDPVAEKVLTESGWTSPDPASYPTGRDWVERYLAPLADLLAEQPGVEIHYGHRVVGVARAGRDRLVAIGRDGVPFTVHVASPDGRQSLTACAVIDASGTWGTPNPLGGDGYPADGEAEHADHILYGIPDLTHPAVAARYAGKHVAVAGRGASAQNALVALTVAGQQAARDPGDLAGPAWRHRQGLRWRRQRPARRPRRAGQERPAGGRGRSRHHRHGLPHQHDHQPRRPPDPDLDRRPAGAARSTRSSW